MLFLSLSLSILVSLCLRNKSALHLLWVQPYVLHIMSRLCFSRRQDEHREVSISSSASTAEPVPQDPTLLIKQSLVADNWFILILTCKSQGQLAICWLLRVGILTNLALATLLAGRRSIWSWRALARDVSCAMTSQKFFWSLGTSKF